MSSTADLRGTAIGRAVCLIGPASSGIERKLLNSLQALGQAPELNAVRSDVGAVARSVAQLDEASRRYAFLLRFENTTEQQWKMPFMFTMPFLFIPFSRVSLVVRALVQKCVA